MILVECSWYYSCPPFWKTKQGLGLLKLSNLLLILRGSICAAFYNLKLLSNCRQILARSIQVSKNLFSLETFDLVFCLAIFPFSVRYLLKEAKANRFCCSNYWIFLHDYFFSPYVACSSNAVFIGHVIFFPSPDYNILLCWA